MLLLPTVVMFAQSCDDLKKLEHKLILYEQAHMKNPLWKCQMQYQKNELKIKLLTCLEAS